MTTKSIALGWREWMGLPELGIPRIKVKVDTGARTATLHAYYVRTIQEQGRLRVRFGVHPLQGRTDIERHCVADVLRQREVTDSGGHREMRVFISTRVVIGATAFPIEVTLTDRDTMRFRMLLGRAALRGGFLVDPLRSYAAGKPTIQE
ncbi:MAG: ATP-dependent zinc protease family protein [Gammaproteobacteria bacterium]